MQFDIDYNLNGGTHNFQGRFVFDPPNNAALQSIQANTWQNWNVLDPNAKWCATGAPRKATCGIGAPCTLSAILGAFPDAGLRTPGVFGIKAGSGWSSFDGNADNLTVGVPGTTTTFDFELGTAPATINVRTDGSDILCNGTDAPGTAAPKCAFQTIQAALNAAVNGDTIIVGDGTFNESPNITKSITFRSAHGRDATTIALQPQPPAATYLGSLEIAAPNVTVDGFTIKGFDGTATTLASSNIYLNNTASTVTTVSITNNRFQVGAINDTSSNGDDGYGILTGSTVTPAQFVDSLTATGNIFAPLTPGPRILHQSRYE